jgi:hypothetical protein
MKSIPHQIHTINYSMLLIYSSHTLQQFILMAFHQNIYFLINTHLFSFKLIHTYHHSIKYTSYSIKPSHTISHYSISLYHFISKPQHAIIYKTLYYTINTHSLMLPTHGNTHRNISSIISNTHSWILT